MKPPFNFPYPTTPSHGAWCLAVALVAHADLNQTPSTAELLLEDVFNKGEGIPREWLQEAVGRAAVFKVTEYESTEDEESSYCMMLFFTGIGYRSTPGRVEVGIQDAPLSYLKQLQEVILQLHQRGTLTPSSLTRKMKAVAPLAELDMKKNRRYKGPVFTLYTRNGKIVDVPMNR